MLLKEIKCSRFKCSRFWIHWFKPLREHLVFTIGGLKFWISRTFHFKCITFQASVCFPLISWKGSAISALLLDAVPKICTCITILLRSEYESRVIARPTLWRARYLLSIIGPGKSQCAIFALSLAATRHLQQGKSFCLVGYLACVVHFITRSFGPLQTSNIINQQYYLPFSTPDCTDVGRHYQVNDWNRIKWMQWPGEELMKGRGGLPLRTWYFSLWS